MAKKGKDPAPRASRGAARSAAPKQPANIYTVMLLIALLALVMGCLFLALEMSAYGGRIRPPTYTQLHQAPGISAPNQPLLA